MDLLFSRYASPLDFMNLYIIQGRFGEFVEEIISLENKRRKENAEKEENDKLWQAYIRSMTDKNFETWKNELKSGKAEGSCDLSMSDGQISSVKDMARGILKGFSPV